MQVAAQGKAPAVRYAAEELARCLGAMTGADWEVARGKQGEVRVGAFGDFDDELEPVEVDDPAWDDAYAICSTGAGLLIAGSNPRAALLGAYGFLRELGARWLWPGADGEYLPELAALSLEGWDHAYRAPFRHRGWCHEGAPGLEHELDMVEWLPRVGMNSYMLQFMHSGWFHRLWYGHYMNRQWPGERELTDEECVALDEEVIAATRQRGLLLHRVGHGWTAAALGMPAVGGWSVYSGEPPAETAELIAEVDGKREIFGGIPINTELCYSNPRAREAFHAAVLEYAQAHPEVDALHVWLSDAVNNVCECEGCQKLSQSDWYMLVLNELAPRLAQVAPGMRIVFLCYTNTMWPPDQVRLADEDRFVFMFAPIGRCYQHRIGDRSCGEDLPTQRPPRNQVVMPASNRGNVQQLEMWEDYAPPDSFAFDYHYWTPWRADYLGYDVAGLMAQDLEDYEELGVGGMVACATLRPAYPTGWAMYGTALGLAGEAPNAGEEERYYRLAFGEGGQVARELLAGVLARRAHPDQGDRWWEVLSREQAEELAKWLEEAESRLDEAAKTAANEREKTAWRVLRHWREFALYQAQAAEAYQAGDRGKAARQVAAAREFLERTEPEVHRFVDAHLMLNSLEMWQASLEGREPEMDRPRG